MKILFYCLQINMCETVLGEEFAGKTESNSIIFLFFSSISFGYLYLPPFPQARIFVL